MATNNLKVNINDEMAYAPTSAEKSVSSNVVPYSTLNCADTADYSIKTTYYSNNIGSINTICVPNSADLTVRFDANGNICKDSKNNKVNKIPKVKDVTIKVENKVVEVTFEDNTKEKSVCLEPDTFDLERAISICIAKKAMGGSSAYNNAVKKGLKVYNDKLRQEAADKAEKERIEKKRAKLKAYKQRRREKREAADRQKQIDIQKEAYIQAMEYMKDKDNN